LRASAAGRELVVSRTGFSGVVGFEVWVANVGALALWVAVVEAGQPFGLTPMGLDALDVSRVEAGFVLMGVDYFSARTAMIESQAATPFEIGLGWTVKLERDPFVGQAALRRAVEQGPRRELVGVEIDWAAYEALYDAFGLPPELHAETCRLGAPLYVDGRQVGQATSRTWSPTLKAYIGLASVAAEHAALGSELEAEVTIEYERLRCPARVVPKPFFDPERKKA
jgi:aminomethyltransferase